MGEILAHLADEGLNTLVDILGRELEFSSHTASFLCKTHCARCLVVECSRLFRTGLRADQILEEGVRRSREAEGWGGSLQLGLDRTKIELETREQQLEEHE